MRNYGDLSTGELRELCLDGELDANSMSLSDYERLFDYETDLDESQSSVLVFCSNGLNQHEAYGKHLPKPSIESVYSKHEQMFGEKTEELEATPKAKKRRFVPTSRWGRLVATIAICVAVGVIALQGVAMAMGYDNVFDLIRSAFSSAERASTDGDGHEMSLTDDFRTYNSVSEMLESENLNILYPVELPIGYKFTDFIIVDSDNSFQLRALAAEPYISFTVEFNVNFQIDNYEYKINGIEYNAFETPSGFYQAEWIYNTDYYAITLGDKTTLSKIIESLTGG
jgi:hypothetical protein